MREHWVDHWGNRWPVCISPRRLKFRNPSHAALRRHVFHRDRFCCVRCPARALHVPDDYDGRMALMTDTFVSSGFRDMLVLDHRLTLRAGGRSVIENLQTLCETCNRRKIAEDQAAAAKYRARH